MQHVVITDVWIRTVIFNTFRTYSILRHVFSRVRKIAKRTVEKIKVPLKCEENNRHFTDRQTDRHLYICDSVSL